MPAKDEFLDAWEKPCIEAVKEKLRLERNPEVVPDDDPIALAEYEKMITKSSEWAYRAAATKLLKGLEPKGYWCDVDKKWMATPVQLIASGEERDHEHEPLFRLTLPKEPRDAVGNMGLSGNLKIIPKEQSEVCNAD